MLQELEEEVSGLAASHATRERLKALLSRKDRLADALNHLRTWVGAPPPPHTHILTATPPPPPPHTLTKLVFCCQYIEMCIARPPAAVKPCGCGVRTGRWCLVTRPPLPPLPVCSKVRRMDVRDPTQAEVAERARQESLIQRILLSLVGAIAAQSNF